MSDVIRAIYKSFYWKQVNSDTVLSSFFLLLKKNSLICTSNVKYHLDMWIKLLTHCFTKGELKWMRSYIYIKRDRYRYIWCCIFPSQPLKVKGSKGIRLLFSFILLLGNKYSYVFLISNNWTMFKPQGLPRI